MRIGFPRDTPGADPAVSTARLYRLYHVAQLAESVASGVCVNFWRDFIAGAVNSFHCPNSAPEQMPKWTD